MLMTHPQVPQALMNTMVAIRPTRGRPRKADKAMTDPVKENLDSVTMTRSKQKDIEITVDNYPVVSDSPHTSSCIIITLAQAVVRCKM